MRLSSLKQDNFISFVDINPLDCKGNYSATSNQSMKLVHWPLMGGLLHFVQRGWDRSPPSPILAVPNVTAHPSTAKLPITVLVYNDYVILLCGFNVSIEG